MTDPLLSTLLALPPALDLWRRMTLALPGDDVRINLDLSWIEQHSHILYPLLAVGTVALLVVGILSAWRSDDISGILKVEYKREVITQLRLDPGGVPVNRLAKRLKLSVHRTARILEEMAKDGQIVLDKRRGVLTARVRL